MTAKARALAAILGLALLWTVALLTAQATRPGETMQLWEYHTEITRGPASLQPSERTDPRRGTGSGADGMLNSWGREGWELVAVTRREIRVDDVMQTETSYAFKRPTRTVNR